LDSKYYVRQTQRLDAQADRNSRHLGAKQGFFYALGVAGVKTPEAFFRRPLKILLQSSNIGSTDPPVAPRWKMANQQQDGSVLEARKTRVKPPPLYKVLLLNDDYTPMDFVVVVLQTVFAMNREKATQVMLQVHREGMGVCGTYVREVAATKVGQVIDIARKHQHPLQCTMEEA
jgi:ATP-dependent Clp protease adaptor protein ClpS